MFHTNVRLVAEVGSKAETTVTPGEGLKHVNSLMTDPLHQVS